ncbi:peptidoglycan DD-metalloendopeptidase family protein [Corynebacterium poyangense]|uniref:Peptidoglycan DD-metalloendopeptidase family protein n=2 Tax=Corynebacterium poyangense TaxID=2684405 RepID=A0A7H0SMT8_9CORY|nr:M23 family metallopeptidase [Corynebacterium poyangense]MBZ8176309.1 peptidoglycan DD-metalloendopeptidase family protein [Corynebacterium poyangense]QNQ89863.1 peptidoglycan DD-metalloendopeptidase family protein [Corynebacterium poyangense]
MTIAAAGVSTAGMGGAAAAQASSNHSAVNYQMVAESSDINQGTSPQILAITENQPMANLQEQLTKAIESNAQRIKAENDERIAAAAEAAKHISEKPGGVVLPTVGTLTSPFGMRWGVLHPGIDLANSIGTPIYSVMDGTVIDAGPASGFGQWIRVQHDDGSISVYGHIETIDVTVGQRVVAGQKIAGMGNRGFSTGPHLHFEIHPGGQAAVDPVAWFQEHGIFISS